MPQKICLLYHALNELITNWNHWFSFRMAYSAASHICRLNCAARHSWGRRSA